MSRAYKIEVKESEQRVIRASDEICTTLELLDILPPEATADLLKKELKSRNFKEAENGTMVREDKNQIVTVDPCSGEVVVKTIVESDKKVEVKREGVAVDDIRDSREKVTKKLKERAQEEIQKEFDSEQKKSQSKATEHLEKAIADLQPEINDIVNKITRESLKAKAAQMGRIQEITENAESGEMTIKIEV